MAQVALERMDPAIRSLAEAQAKARGVSAIDAVLEAGLRVASEQTGEALYALKRSQSRPQLRAVQ